MPRKKISESLSVRVFLITASLLLFAGAITFGFIAWAAPSTYTAVMNDDLAAQVDVLVEQLADTAPEDCGKLLDEFALSSGATATLTGPDGHLVDTGAQIEVQAVYESGDMIVTAAEGDRTASFGTAGPGSENTVAITMSEQSAIAAEVRFAGREEGYTLYVTPRLKAENVAVRALVQMAPWLLLVLLTFSLLCAFFYSRYITRPIVRMSDIAGKMAELDFHWECGETRRDEIGQLGRSLDTMAGKLSTALAELESANQALRGEVERERELDQQRVAFFNAASHELKTPVTILKGQLTGMLEGVGVYQNRDKYLLRSLQVTGRMEHLVQEMLAISRMEAGAAAMKQETVELSTLIEEQLQLDAGLLEQRGQHLVRELTPGITTNGDAVLLGKVLGNLISNASLYSPDGAEIRVWCGWQNGRPAVTVENTGAHIEEDALPHLYEAFYREECSRNRASGGSGLGLYLVKMILDRHGAACTIENTADGVRVSVRFVPSATSGLPAGDVVG
ncbi:sensor histidine kinase [Flintibacter sp.]|uniref:sensor histidine kinase n=1 Tax=Flintibacter sp. TaxID=1918624 RepID=UPI003A3CFCD8